MHSGKPPKWTPSSQPQHLHEDGGIYYRDPNAARHPKYPTEPAIRAIFEQHPDFDPSHVDIVGCGSTLGSLLSFARGEERTFRFGIERIGNTTFLVRKTNTPGETIEEVRGYGHTFPEAYTTWEKDVRSSASHQRIIMYEFADLKLLVRSESDGYIPDKAPTVTADFNLSRSHDQAAETSSTGKDAGSLASSLALTLGVSGSSSALDKPLQVVRSSNIPIAQSAVFDLKTRSVKQRPDLATLKEQFYPRLWINQTPTFLVAFHTRGTFQPSEIHIMDVKDDVQAWELRNESMTTRLSLLYQKLIGLSGKHNGQRFEVRRTGNGQLEIWLEVPEWSALPEALKQRWSEGGLKESCESEKLQEEELVKKAEVKTEGSDDSDDEDYLKF